MKLLNKRWLIIGGVVIVLFLIGKIFLGGDPDVEDAGYNGARFFNYAKYGNYDKSYELGSKAFQSKVSLKEHSESMKKIPMMDMYDEINYAKTTKNSPTNVVLDAVINKGEEKKYFVITVVKEGEDWKVDSYQWK